MIIPDIGIKKLVEDGFLPPGLTIGPSSVDLTLSDSFSWPKPDKDKIILGESVPHKQVQKDEFVLEPNHFVLASTAESIRVPHDMAAYVEGHSSIGRLRMQAQNCCLNNWYSRTGLMPILMWRCKHRPSWCPAN